MLANAVAKGKNKKLNLLKGNIFLNKKGKIIKDKINFFVKRKGNTIGEHSLQIYNGSEKIELKHIASSRELFADGAIDAAIWIKNKKNGLFNMQDMLGLN
jgi:4-hydroxy-tetrahydrodipicolinate reductase